MKIFGEVTRNNKQIGFKRGMNLIVSEKLKFTGAHGDGRERCFGKEVH